MVVSQKDMDLLLVVDFWRIDSLLRPRHKLFFISSGCHWRAGLCWVICKAQALHGDEGKSLVLCSAPLLRGVAQLPVPSHLSELLREYLEVFDFYDLCKRKLASFKEETTYNIIKQVFSIMHCTCCNTGTKSPSTFIHSFKFFQNQWWICLPNKEVKFGLHENSQFVWLSNIWCLII